LQDILFSKCHTITAPGDVEVAAAKEELVSLAWKVLVGIGTGKAIGAIGDGGGEETKEDVEVGLVDAVGSKEGDVLAVMQRISN